MDILEKLKLNSEILKDTDISEKIIYFRDKIISKIQQQNFFCWKWWFGGSSATFFN